MINSIQHFQENGIGKLEKVFVDYSADMTKVAEMVKGVKENVINLGLSMIAEEFEAYDEYLRSNKHIRPEWLIVRRDETTLLTSLGSVTYRKTLFKNKLSGKSEYLLDRVMGIEKHARLTEDAEAELLLEAVQTSYRRGGEAASITEERVSKETVMNKIHRLQFPGCPAAEKKKVADCLYIDADEDHVSLQFREKKGDLVRTENNRKNNNAIAKLVYVYEGIEKEAPKSKRHKLINPYYFCSGSSEKSNEEFWEEIWEYIESHYEVNRIKKIYLNSDGGAWIECGKKNMAGIIPVLDGFHLEKYLTKMTSHMEDSTEDAKAELRAAIRSGTKREFEEVVDRLKNNVSSESGRKRLEESEKYILSNWMAARRRLVKGGDICGCSAEGHVSHVLSSRMSSRPLGWSVKGMSKMTELRAYYCNGGDMLELVRYQQKEQDKAAGCEEVIFSCRQLLSQERKRRDELGIYGGLRIYSIPYPQVKKIANFKNHIYGL